MEVILMILVGNALISAILISSHLILKSSNDEYPLGIHLIHNQKKEE